MELKKNNFVLVLPTFKSNTKWSYAGFGGRIESIWKNTVFKVVWDSITLNTFTDEYLKWLLENDFYPFDYNFGSTEIIQANPRDTLKDVYAAQEQVYNRKVKLSSEVIPLIEDLYNRFCFTEHYAELTDTQKEKSWFIISAFNKFMEENEEYAPEDWEEDTFIHVYTDSMQNRILGNKMLYNSYKKVLMQFLTFLQFKMLIPTDDLKFALKKLK